LDLRIGSKIGELRGGWASASHGGLRMATAATGGIVGRAEPLGDLLLLLETCLAILEE
jgi:hypothetical protein